MKKIKFNIYLFLVLIVLSCFYPILNAKVYAAVTVSEVTATSNLDSIVPVINQTKKTPVFTVTNSDIVKTNFNNVYWQKQNGTKWSYYSKNVFEAGTYRYYYSFYIPEGSGQFASTVKLTVDGKTQNCESRYIAGDGYYIFGYSKEYVAQTSTLKSYKVVFESNGGTKLSDKYIEEGERILSHGTPYKEGYTFVGWYSDKELTRQFSFATPITSNITLYAKWLKEGQYLKGDLDRNNVIDANDASIALEIFKAENATAEDILIGDMDDNKLIDANDASLILELYKTNN